ncbi:TlpA disulfide reductase family protein [Oleiagrimonas sp. C23AA]|uniref:TlpA family protein disulfide reductase n=1 Tax=Oleiagrimonas sp. C23AA TaxID=2719047 RepID=UPI001423A2FA|nr:TlpA disulfide reductase family protein [Oleiagrimonas sp. C23AA]NII12308.1 TlpA family protein disulfide reductase [Oleiagrimonas sp. C23AA]
MGWRRHSHLLIVLAAVVVGGAVAFAGSWIHYGGPPPALMRLLVQTRLGDQLLQAALRHQQPAAPKGTTMLGKGDRLPALAFTGADGRRYRLDQWHGKTVLINFWATWCQPCRREMPHLIAAQKRLAGSVQIVGIALDTPQAVHAFLATHPLNYPVLLGGTGNSALSARFGDTMGALPFSVLVAPDGRIKATHYGPLVAVQLHWWLD